MSALGILRQVKHGMFVNCKLARRAIQEATLLVNDRRWRGMEERRPFQYLSAYYPHTFLARATPATGTVREFPRRIFVIWFGSQPMNANRFEALASIQDANIDVPVELVTDETLGQWIIPEAPFHPAYDKLSAVHKSDYVRAYLMHHHGGGYCDVKPLSASWSEVFDSLDRDRDLVAAGYREVTSAYTPDLPRNLGAHLKRHYRAVFGTSAFIFRPGSGFTTEWMRELHARMDYYAPALSEVTGQNSYSPDPEYPIRWTEILGDITQPLSFKYQDRLIFDDKVKPSLKNYR